MVREHSLTKRDYCRVWRSCACECSLAISTRRNIENIENHRHHRHCAIRHADGYSTNSCIRTDTLNMRRVVPDECFERDYSSMTEERTKGNCRYLSVWYWTFPTATKKEEIEMKNTETLIVISTCWKLFSFSVWSSSRSWWLDRKGIWLADWSSIIEPSRPRSITCPESSPGCIRFKCFFTLPKWSTKSGIE